jgi:hypothetical protein
MKVLCKYSANKDVPSAAVTNTGLPTTVFDVVVGREYVVYAQAIFASRLLYLIDPDESCRPNWYPPELFEITDGSIPASWKFAFYAGQFINDLGAIWGYEELISNDDHFNGLAERDAAALEHFARLKLRINLEQT